jgi:hypothetical protein
MLSFDMRKALAPILILAVAVGGSTLSGHGASSAPECHVHKSKEVGFQGASSKDVLEVSIGTGPCRVATLSIVVRTDSGVVLYSYAAEFSRHVPDGLNDATLRGDAVTFVEGMFGPWGIASAAERLPPYEEPEAFEQKHFQSIAVTKAQYEELRSKGQPVLCHPTYHEGSQCVTFNKAENTAIVVMSGGL